MIIIRLLNRIFILLTLAIGFVIMLLAPTSVLADGWEIMNSSASVHLVGIWGCSPSEIFAVGQASLWTSLSTALEGVIVQYKDNKWVQMNCGKVESLTSVWGSSSSDVFAVGVNGTILHYDGERWEKMDSGTTGGTIECLSGVWGTSPTDVFVVGWPQSGYSQYDKENASWHWNPGGGNTILHWNGSEWSDISFGSLGDSYLNSVWGNSSTDVFAVGLSGRILHYNGSEWTEMDSGTHHDLNDVWGTSHDNVFAVGEFVPICDEPIESIILHYNGSVWKEMELESTTVLLGIWGSSSDDIYAAGLDGLLHYNGNSWSKVNNISLFDIWGSSSNDVYAVGPPGIILHYDGSPQSTVTPIPTLTLVPTPMQTSAPTSTKGLSAGAWAGVGISILVVMGIGGWLIIRRWQ